MSMRMHVLEDWIQTVLTFRNVALSLVTMDGLTLMLSCIMDVKLQKKTTPGRTKTKVNLKSKELLQCMLFNGLLSLAAHC